MSGSTLYDSPSLYNIEPPAHIGNRRPKSLKQQLLKNNKENECMKCRVSFEVRENAFRSRRKRTHTHTQQRLVQTEKQLKSLREELSTIQREREMEKECNDKKIRDMQRRHQHDLEKISQQTTACSCVIS